MELNDSRAQHVRSRRKIDAHMFESQATVAAQARAELRNQRRLNDESPRPETPCHANNLITPVQLGKCHNDCLEVSSLIDGDTVAPEDSLTSRCRLGKRPDEAKMTEREMVELRQLVQSDDRFGAALERSCQAVYECISAGNPSPILALLASLVWRSLCIAWELEPNCKVAKTHLRSKIACMQDEQQHIIESFDDARSRYLKELISLRDQVRRRNGHALAAVHKVVHDEEPVIYYEPLKYLSDQTKTHIADIVEEKLKQLVATLEDQPYVPPEKKPAKDEEAEKEEEDDDEADRRAQEAERAQRKLTLELEKERRRESLRKGSQNDLEAKQLAAASAAAQQVEEASKEMEAKMTKLAEESQSKTDALQRTITSMQGDLSAVEADLNTMMSAAQQEWQDLKSALDEHGSVKLNAPPQKGAAAESTLNAVEAKHRFEYMAEMLGAQKHVRKTLLARLNEEKQKAQDLAAEAAALKSKSNKPPPAATPPSAAATAVAKADLDKEKAKSLKANQALADQQEEAKAAKEHAQAAEQEASKAREELAEAKANAEREEDARRSGEKELAKAQKKIRELSEEVEKLRMLLDQIDNNLEERNIDATESSETAAKRPPKAVSFGAISEKLSWRQPSKKVFERLFQDSVDRHERRSTLVASLAQARDEHALEIFKSNLNPFSNYDCSGFLEAMDSYEEAASFGPGVQRAQTDGWLMDRAYKSPHPSRSSSPTAAEAQVHAFMMDATPSAPTRSPSPGVDGVDRVSVDIVARSPSPSQQFLRAVVTPSPPVNGRPALPPRTRSRSPQGVYAVDLEVEGRQMGAGSRSNSPDRLGIDHLAQVLHASPFATAMGLEYAGSPPGVHCSPPPEMMRPPPRMYTSSPKGSRPSSASSTGALHKAKSTITARPRSAALPAIQRMHRPPSEAALLKEAQRLLASPANPSGKIPGVGPLVRSSSTPGLSRGRPQRPRSGAR